MTEKEVLHQGEIDSRLIDYLSGIGPRLGRLGSHSARSIGAFQAAVHGHDEQLIRETRADMRATLQKVASEVSEIADKLNTRVKKAEHEAAFDSAE